MRLSVTVIVSRLVITTRLCYSVVALQPAAPRPPSHHATAASIPDPPTVLELEQYEPSFLDNALLVVFRWTLQQQQSQGPRSNLAGFDGMVDELMEFRRVYGLDEQERVSYQTMIALSGPIPWIYRHLFSSTEWSPAVLAWFAKHLLSFLVGDMELTERSDTDHRSGGVLVHRCRVLEGTKCKGVCAKMCKLPTQRFFAQEWGVPLSMTPNFETGQCQLAFGVVPIPVEQDPTIPEGCLTRCPAFPMVVPEQRELGMYAD
jgi:Beta-carotene isomerase D27-like, C-terminal